MMVPILNAEHCLNSTQDLSSGFSELLNTLRIDDVSDTIKGDKILLMIGNRYFNSLKRKKDKKLETCRYVRSRLRLTARVYITFKSKMSNIVLDNLENNLADMFRRETITILGKLFPLKVLICVYKLDTRY